MLQFPPDDLLACSRFFLLTDEISAPADFILHRLLAQKYKASKGSKVIVLSTSSDLDRWKTLASKSNINLGQLATNGSFIFVDLLNEAVLPISEPFGNAITRSLRPLYDMVETELSVADVDNRPLVILDDVSSLAWLGFSTLELSRFTRAVWAICRKSNASLVCRYHILDPAEPESLFQKLLQLASYHIEVRPLASGRSGAVSGEVCMHLGPSEPSPDLHLISRQAAVQYRLTDIGSVFFEKGTSVGVL
ncbi:hypothetical protein CONPUDRAFT_121514 [Coniophora puteana RWD-64-598 SS2]|uniref:Elongator complex protein 5 n=1 Tax=Coniophora puteana (strain RWD-64-598) TaxID=741705 RepID=A0A5M3MVG2_CONPW|nr:uncharacterized protein CONPUDRAFT_121514 [Coniophora puteana RWD-64-598 SS2]EIW83116.1 hypothetical protein CONPUDRAFT_121514 [Coniophora puteana RWD-64-598 SS2]